MSAEHNKLAEIFDAIGRQFAEKCTNCGECLQVCPIFPMTRFAEQGPEAVIEKVTDLLSGGPASEEVHDLVFSCTGQCRLCGSACPEGLSLQTALMSAAAKLADAGKAPPESIYQLTPGHRYGFTRVFNALLSRPSEARWLTKVPEHPEPVDVVFFAGCGLTGLPQTFLDAVEILKRMKVNFIALAGGGICCGSTPILWGDLEASQKIGQDFVSAISAFSPKKAVFYCAGCQGMCLGMLPMITSIPFETYLLSQFLAENIDRIPFIHAIDKSVTVHDSCSIASLGNFESTRRVLEAVPGVTLVEMAHNRENALCCGGVANYLRPEITESIRRAPLKEAEAAGADILATICTGCQQSFVPFESQYPFEVRSYISMIAEAAGVGHEDRFSRYMKLGDVDQVITEAQACIEENDFTMEEMADILPEYFNRMCIKRVRTIE